MKQTESFRYFLTHAEDYTPWHQWLIGSTFLINSASQAAYHYLESDKYDIGLYKKETGIIKSNLDKYNNNLVSLFNTELAESAPYGRDAASLIYNYTIDMVGTMLPIQNRLKEFYAAGFFDEYDSYIKAVKEFVNLTTNQTDKKWTDYVTSVFKYTAANEHWICKSFLIDSTTAYANLYRAETYTKLCAYFDPGKDEKWDNINPLTGECDPNEKEEKNDASSETLFESDDDNYIEPGNCRHLDAYVESKVGEFYCASCNSILDIETKKVLESEVI